MKKSWEKILLAVLLVVVGAAAAGLALLFPPVEEILGFSPSGGTAKNAVPVKADAVTELSQLIKNPPRWSEPTTVHALFTARQWIYDSGKKEVQLVETGNTMVEGISIDWINKYRLPVADGVALGDPDQDGFANSVEYKDKTDPTDAKSHPPYISRLRLKEFEFIPFRIRFNGLTQLNGEDVFQLNLQDAPAKKSRLVKMGEDVEGYKVKAYRPKKGVKDVGGSSIEVDVSELDLVREDIDLTVTLVLNVVKDSPDSTANFLLLLPGTTETPIKVRRGQDFELAQEKGVKYRLIGVEKDKATIKVLEGGSIIAVPLLGADDFKDIPGGTPSGTETPGSSATP
jgi:hypothetical protein